MQKVYQRINWENDPSTNTPLSEDNLNKIDYALDKIDDRVVQLGGYQDRVAQSEKNAKTSETNAKASETNAKQSEVKAKQYMENAFSGTPEGYAALVEQVRLLDIVKSTAYTYPHTKPGGLRLLEMTGKTEQKTLSGKNLLNVPDKSTTILGVSVEVKDGVITVSGTATGSGGRNNYLSRVTLPAGTYTVSLHNKSGTIPLIYLTNVADTSIVFARFNGNTTFTLAEETTLGLGLNFVTESTYNYSCNIQIEAGEVATDYEPYCGGIPSPNPDYQQAIENVGDCVEMIQGAYGTSGGGYTSATNRVCNRHPIPCKGGDIVEFDCEKSLIPNLYYYNENGYLQVVQGTNGYEHTFTVPSGVTKFNFRFGNADDTDITPQTVGKITLKINGKHVVQFVEHGKNMLDMSSISGIKKSYNGGIYDSVNHIITCKSGQVLSGIYFPMEGLTIGKTYTLSVCVKGTANARASILRNTNPVEVYLSTNYIRYDSTFVASKTSETIVMYIRNATDDCIIQFKDFMCEESPVATPYEPYTEKVATIFLDEPLREGDRLVKVDGVWNVERKMFEAVFDGDEYTEKNTTNSDDYLYFINLPKAKKKFSNGLCDKLTHKNISKLVTFGNVGFNINNENNVIYVNLSNHMSDNTVSAFKTVLQENPIKVQYELATPTLTPLDLESQKALNNLETFKDMTYLEVDSKIKPSGIEVEYGTSQVSARALKEELRNDTDQVERTEMKTQIETLRNMILSLGGNV